MDLNNFKLLNQKVRDFLSQCEINLQKSINVEWGKSCQNSNKNKEEQDKYVENLDELLNV